MNYSRLQRLSLHIVLRVTIKRISWRLQDNIQVEILFISIYTSQFENYRKAEISLKNEKNVKLQRKIFYRKKQDTQTHKKKGIKLSCVEYFSKEKTTVVSKVFISAL